MATQIDEPILFRLEALRAIVGDIEELEFRRKLDSPTDSRRPGGRTEAA